MTITLITQNLVSDTNNICNNTPCLKKNGTLRYFKTSPKQAGGKRGLLFSYLLIVNERFNMGREPPAIETVHVASVLMVSRVHCTIYIMNQSISQSVNESMDE